MNQEIPSGISTLDKKGKNLDQKFMCFILVICNIYIYINNTILIY